MAFMVNISWQLISQDLKCFTWTITFNPLTPIQYLLLLDPFHWQDNWAQRANNFSKITQVTQAVWQQHPGCHPPPDATCWSCWCEARASVRTCMHALDTGISPAASLSGPSLFANSLTVLLFFVPVCLQLTFGTAELQFLFSSAYLY